MLSARTIRTTPEASRTATRAPARSQTTPRSRDVRATAVGEAIMRVEGEYREMPGLSLTLPQAARLLGMDRSTCELVLAILIERRVLKRALNGTYVRR